MNDRTATTYHKLIGRIDEDYYFLDDIFKYSDNFQGATATIVRPVYKDEFEDEEIHRDWCEELWRMAVSDGYETRGLDDYASDIEPEERFDTGMHSSIYDKMRELYPDEDEVPLFECVGGGRSFSKDMKFDEVFDEKLLKEIEKVEA